MLTWCADGAYYSLIYPSIIAYFFRFVKAVAKFSCGRAGACIGMAKYTDIFLHFCLDFTKFILDKKYVLTMDFQGDIMTLVKVFFQVPRKWGSGTVRRCPPPLL